MKSIEMKKELNWSKLYQNRLRIRKDFGNSIFKIPITRDFYQKIASLLEKGSKILDVGAYDRKLKERLIAKGFEGEYKSMDIDQSTEQDYYSLEEIKEQFDCVIMSEVVEHLRIDELSKILAHLQSIIKPKGYLIISTPNIYHPHRYFDATHVTPWRYDELGGFLRLNDYEVLHILRVVFNDRMLRRLIRGCGAIFLNRYFQLDFAESIIVVCRKN